MNTTSNKDIVESTMEDCGDHPPVPTAVNAGVDIPGSAADAFVSSATTEDVALASDSNDYCEVDQVSECDPRVEDEDAQQGQKEPAGRSSARNEKEAYIARVLVDLQDTQKLKLKEPKGSTEESSIVCEKIAKNKRYVEPEFVAAAFPTATFDKDQQLQLLQPEAVQGDRKNVHEPFDTFVSDIQPLPSPAPRQDGAAAVQPGAYAVVGRPIFLRVSAAPPTAAAASTSTPQDTATMNENTVIGGAVLVDGTEDEESDGMNPTQNLFNTHHHQQQPGNLNPDTTYNEPREVEVLEAKILPERKTEPQADGCSTRNILLVSFASVLVILVGLLALLLILLSPPCLSSACEDSGPDMVGTNPSSTNTSTTADIEYDPFRPYLPPFMEAGIQEVGSVFYWANAWMQNDPYLRTYSKQRQTQRFKMLLYYYATGGPDWFHNDDWLSYTVPECEWHSQHDTTQEAICDEDNHLIIFNMSANNLTGQMVKSTKLAWPKLRVYDISFNSLYGPPPTIVSSNAENLEVLVLSHNQFSGKLTSEGGFSAFSLRVAKLDSNQLTGYQPQVYMALPKLEIMNISNNQYDQDIPSQLQYCQNLTYLGMADNLYTGTIPTELGLLSHLEEVHVSGNADLQGIIPTEFGLLPKLATLDIAGTLIDGEIPESLCSRSGNATEQDAIVPPYEGEVPLDIIANCSRVQCCVE